MSFTYLLLCGFIYLSAAKEEGKIIGGVPIQIGDAPYQISFRYLNQHFCGGTIMSPTWIVTAAHCVAEFRNVNGLTIVAGQTKLSEKNGQKIAITKMTPHPQYNSESVDYDVAVLHLAEPLVFNENVSALELSEKPVPARSMAFVTGWGTTKQGGGGKVSNQLLGVDVKVQSWLACQLQYLLKLTSRMFCAGDFFGGKDSCQGDSGGPVEYNEKLVGIVSFGRGCGDIASPGVYTQVSSVIGFIKNATSSED